MKRSLKWIVGSVVALVVIVSAGTFVYIHFIEGDPPAKLATEKRARVAERRTASQ